jgi:hypothetical protein
LCWGSAGAFAALAVSVQLGLEPIDLIIRDWARPHDVWGLAQRLSDIVVDGLRPAVLSALQAAFTLMGGSLLLQAAHWFTDILGGGLLPAAVLAIAIASGGSRWIHDQSLDDHESVGSEREGQMLSMTSTGQADIDSRPI